MEKLSHKELVSRACKWLQGSAHCPVVLYEAKGDYEIPDAIGWKRHGHESILIECKTTYSDFKKDAEKISRKVKGMGMYRYFLTPKNLVKAEELPEKWGLLEIREYQVRLIKKAEQFDNVSFREEMGLMYTALHRQSDNIQKINQFLTNVWPLRGHFNGSMAVYDNADILDPHSLIQMPLET